MAEQGLSVAVTGPTGEIGVSFIRALEGTDGVGEIRGMARRPFDPKAHGFAKTRYVQGDILDRKAVDEFVAGADVVVHLAFIIFGGRDETRSVNLKGSRNVFEATAAAGAKRLVYTSSVAAYGFHKDNPQPLTEDVAPRGTGGFYYSAQKAELEATLRDALEGSGVDAYVFRPSIVAGPESPALVVHLPRVSLPGLPTIVPDTGVRLQLVHADDVAAALCAAVVGAGPPGIYNLAGDGDLSIPDVAHALGWSSLPVPQLAVQLGAEAIDLIPVKLAKLEWIHMARVPVLMDTAKTRRKLGWDPQHDAAGTLAETVSAAREKGLV